MKFILENTVKQKPLTLIDVPVDTFFVDSEGKLCQMVSKTTSACAYNIITTPNGTLYACSANRENTEPILRVITGVVKIEY